MKLETAELDEWMRAAFPVRGGNVEMAFVKASFADDAFRITVHLIVYDGQGVRDIKEQEIVFCTAQEAEPKERVRALVEGWAAVLADVLRDIGDRVDYLMPHDLAPGSAIRLARSRTREDFEHALRAKGRLGKHLKS